MLATYKKKPRVLASHKSYSVIVVHRARFPSFGRASNLVADHTAGGGRFARTKPSVSFGDWNKNNDLMWVEGRGRGRGGVCVIIICILTM